MTYWERFSDLCKSEFERCEFKKELIQACAGSEKIAWVVFRHTQTRLLSWMQSKIPALGGKTPRECAQHEPEKLKKVLLSFPC
ncbi:hypothetical protein PSECIP111951_00027 [Pseudoalteromonas holothuriae]|uniref:Antitoxin Xre/MbcA/ParS-like toxin-binding domain-containing protein n=1 Tax=Pseudoalteromonas holothuriae TaxID=2963714 RepID=A0ABM9GD29_9GAMM|nr:MbcA/ParS/Xre antitoxin family protein [Pseudoalteromonas sp. CIP111951]CAH9049770.1 hypothetical protein PSECIP111951_00027 [Pseudoalteromonas sp. CIP111951]